jgi:multimeric flavodoxin WrbA
METNMNKVLAVTAGRKYGNTEILAKEVLMIAQENGAEVNMINLHDHEIKICTGCEACTMKMGKGERPECIYKGKDDMDEIMEQFLQADGIVISIPTFVLQPQGIYKVFIDRWLPYEVALLIQAGVLDEVPERVAVIITVGGSTQNWMSLTLPALQMSMFMQSIKVVDQMMATRSTRPGQVLLYPEFVERARKLGHHLVEAMNTPYDEVKWLGEDGWCPVCHSNLMMLGKPHWDGTSYAIECAMCGAGGSFEVEDGNTRFVVAEDGLKHCRIFTEGRYNHLLEIKETHEHAFENIKTIKSLIERYKKFKLPGV